MPLAENTVLIGRRPIMVYVRALMTALHQGTAHILARGRSISTAVDVVEMTRNTFLSDLKVEDILIGTVRLGETGNERNVSTVEIVVSRDA